MAKIPTFTSQGELTTQTGSVQTNIQMGLDQNLASALSPITKKIVDYKVKEKNVQNKTEALELENQAIVELNGYVQEASNLKDADAANKYLMEKSKIVRTKYANKASNSNVKTLFSNNYLLEEQKKVYAVDNAVHKNLINSRLLLSNAKEERVLSDALYSEDNALALSTLETDLTAIYKSDFDDGIINIAEYESRVADIPNKIDYFKAKKDSINDPVGTFAKLSKGEYENLTIKTRENLLKEIRLEAVPILQEDMKNYIIGLENGIDVDVNKEAIKEVFGTKAYTNFLETEQNTIRVGETKAVLMNSKIGEEQAILDGFNLDSGNLAQDLEYKQKLINALADKNKLIEEDAATLIIQSNKTVQGYYTEYQNEPEGENKQRLFKKYMNSVVQAQIDMGIDSSLIKAIPENFAKSLVKDYQSQDPQGKMNYLRGLEEQYGEQYGLLLNQLTANGLPVTAKLVSYLGDEDVATQIMSIDTPEEKKILDDFIKKSDLNKNEIEREVFDAMKELRDVVMFSNKMNTTRANKEMNDIEEIITYVAINKISSGTKQKDAVEQATSYVMSKFKFAGADSMIGDGSQNTYFIPKIYNNSTLSNGQMNLIERKATAIKEKHLEDFDMFSFQSEFEDDSKELDKEMLAQAKENGVWVNNADGSGIVFAIPFADGSLALVENKKGELLELKFDDGSHLLPTTNIRIELEIYETNKEEDQTP
tara:strand:- start:9815 stop:11941 length:2127 start_codon:yes stop_codon:yes gene_type:complete